MNLGVAQARALALELKAAIRSIPDRDVAVFPTFVSVADLAKIFADSPVKVGAQNCAFDKDGALTGEVSASIVRSTGAAYVIIGHSERRHVLGETDATTAKKMQQALANGLSPILCVGETTAERDAGSTSAVVARQVRAGLEGIAPKDMGRVVLAYEPVWAIGTGKTATPDQAEAVHRDIRSLLAAIYDKQIAEGTRILYGGSVKAQNIDGLMAMPDIDGALVGGAALEAPSFIRIVNFEDIR